MVIVTGSLAFDYIMDFQGNFSDHIHLDKVHIINLSFLVNSLKREKGGTAGNIAYTLSLLKHPVSIVSSAGEDFFDYQTLLINSNIDTSYIEIVRNEKTSQAFMVTDRKDNLIASFYPGALKNNEKLKIKNVKISPRFVVISPNTPISMANFVNECISLEIPFMYDPGMQLPVLDNEDLKKGINSAEILAGNDYEISLIKSRLNLTDEQILKHVKILITTQGDHGSIIKTKDREFKIKASQANLVDPTGAGDAYRAGFIAGYLQNLDLKICGQIGSIAACYAVENYGTTNHSFTLAEFKNRYKSNFKEELILE